MLNLNRNNLDQQSSTYLLQHKDNPVNWQPWSDELLEHAQMLNKLLIVSIGYSSCHWCHVMEHESFEDREVAEVMNRDFISIKVDREERPDVDQVYMNACVLMTGQGGWPLNIVVLPDGRPVFAGTYFPKKSWLSILKQILEMRKNDKKKLLEVAESVVSGIKNQNILPDSTQNNENGREIFKKTGRNILEDIDLQYGGFKGAPKFPLPSALMLLADQFRYTSDEEFFNALKITLDKMALGGIYDHIGGGFARYSTDIEWKVPHFEKMLYDNVQLLSIYSEAYKLIRSELYKNVVYETADFLQRELYVSNEDEGISGFYSSLDADSEGVEGKFYVWKNEELKSLAGENFPLIEEYFNLNKDGNWEDGNNILFRTFDKEWFLNKYKISSAEMGNIIGEFRKKLLATRESRVRPERDTKIITAWNSLAVSGLIDSYSAFNDNKFLELSRSCLEFLEKKMIRNDGNLFRIFDSEKTLPSINGFLDDYAFTIEAMIKFYQVSFEEKWIYLAEKLTGYTIEHFHNSEGSMFYYKSDKDKALIVKNYEIQDNVIPSSNATMAGNLYYLGELLQNRSYSELSQKMVQNLYGNFIRSGVYFSRWCSLLGSQIDKPYEIVITGKNTNEFRDLIAKHFIPHAIFMGGQKEGKLPLLKGKYDTEKTMIYICKDRVCNLPVDNVDDALLQLNVNVK